MIISSNRNTSLKGYSHNINHGSLYPSGKINIIFKYIQVPKTAPQNTLFNLFVGTCSSFLRTACAVWNCYFTIVVLVLTLCSDTAHAQFRQPQCIGQVCTVYSSSSPALILCRSPDGSGRGSLALAAHWSWIAGNRHPKMMPSGAYLKWNCLVMPCLPIVVHSLSYSSWFDY